MNDTVEIGLDLCPKVVDTRIFDRSQIPIAGDVRDNVEAPKALDCEFSRGDRSAIVGHMERSSNDLRAESCRELLKLLCSARCDDSIVSGRQHNVAQSTSETTRPPGDQPRFG